LGKDGGRRKTEGKKEDEERKRHSRNGKKKEKGVGSLGFMGKEYGGGGFGKGKGSYWKVPCTWDKLQGGRGRVKLVR